MSHKTNITVSKPDQGASLKNYITGFIASLGLTLMAYLAVTQEAFSRNILIAFITGLALVQFIVQMVFFMHIGNETKPRWKLLVFLFMILVVFILVAGSLWIMNNLNYRMSPEDMDSYMRSQQGF